MPEKVLPLLSVPEQEQLNWCWAATTVGIMNFYNPPTREEPDHRQCAVVGRRLGQDVCGATRGNTIPEEFNVQSGLTLPLHEAGHHVVTFANQLSFDEITAEIDAGRPVCVRVVWERGFGGGHFAVIAGYSRNCPDTDTGSDQMTVEDVLVEDSLFGRSLHTFASFRRFYQTQLQNEDGSEVREGRWTHSYYTRPKPTEDPQPASGGASV